MVEKTTMSFRNVVDLAHYRQLGAAKARPLAVRICRHCGAPLAEGECEEECSGALNVDVLRLRWQAAQILRGLS